MSDNRTDRAQWRLAFVRGVFCAVARIDGKQVRRSLGSASREEAVQHFADFVKRPTGSTIGEIVTAYLLDRETRPSIASMREAWRAAQSFFAPYRPDQITRKLCIQYADRRTKSGVKPGTIIKELGTIRAAVNWADKNNSAVFEFPPAPPPRKEWITKDQARALLMAADSPHIYLFIHLAIATAGRREAILDLTWDRVDFDRRLIVLDAERRGGKSRATLPMSDTVRWPLALAHSIRISDYVIEYGGDRVASIRKGFATAVRRAGLDANITPHVIRHSVASWMASDGVPMSVIAEYLGHSDPAVTAKVYAKLSPQYMAVAKGSVEL
jgi:integrase